MPLDSIGAIYYSLAMSKIISPVVYRSMAWAYKPSFKRAHPELFPATRAATAATARAAKAEADATAWAAEAGADATRAARRAAATAMEAAADAAVRADATATREAKEAKAIAEATTEAAWLVTKAVRSTARAAATAAKRAAQTDSERRATQMSRNFAWLWNYLSSRGCACGESDIRVLDLHHRDPEQKAFTVSQGARRYSTERIKAEVLKCDVVCANCHRRQHATRLDRAVSYGLMTREARDKYILDNSPGHA